MKATGFIRKADGLGRITLPPPVRISTGIQPSDQVQFCVEGNRICIFKFEPTCAFCGEYRENMRDFKNKRICAKCSDDLYK